MESSSQVVVSSVRDSPFMAAGGVVVLVRSVSTSLLADYILTVRQYVVYQICRILYNIFLHPLSKFPGPRLRSAFSFVNYVEEIQGIQAPKAKALHDQYGPVVRIGPDSLSFNTSKAWKGVCGLPLDQNCSAKGLRKTSTVSGQESQSWKKT